MILSAARSMRWGFLARDDIGKTVGPLVLAVLQFWKVYSLYKSDRVESLR